MIDSGASAAGEAFTQLATFLTSGRLTGVVGALEHELNGSDASGAAAAARTAGMTPELLTSALLVRRDLGRLNDLVHAAAITLALPRILEPGEELANRPSLAAGNDPTRLFDVETNMRVAEFKLSLWSGTDAMRKRGVFHDMVNLAADTSGRRPELYVVGALPLRFLRSSRSTARWALNHGADSTRELFLNRFWPLDISIRDFTAGPACRVRLIDLAAILPQVRIALDDRPAENGRTSQLN